MFYRKIFLTVIGLLIASQSFGQSPKTVTQNDSILVVDSVTQETVAESLVIPFYSVGRGAFVVPDGPGTEIKENYYFGNPIIYRTGAGQVIPR